MSGCEHYACQQDTAINDGHCPICQADEIERLSAQVTALQGEVSTKHACVVTLERELAEAQDNWWKHPKAQLEIGLKARLSLRLQHIESIVHGTPRDEIGIDDDYWCDLCDKVLAMRDKLAEARRALTRIEDLADGSNDLAMLDKIARIARNTLNADQPTLATDDAGDAARYRLVRQEWFLKENLDWYDTPEAFDQYVSGLLTADKSKGVE